MSVTTCDCGRALTERERRVGQICDACYAIHRPDAETAAADVRQALFRRAANRMAERVDMLYYGQRPTTPDGAA